jgi:uncharacterized low-complexity protein
MLKNANFHVENTNFAYAVCMESMLKKAVTGEGACEREKARRAEALILFFGQQST